VNVKLKSLLMRRAQPVDVRWRHGAEWTVKVSYRQLNDDDDDDDDDRWKELFVTSEATSMIVQGLRPDRQYLIIVNARNEIGYNASLTPESIVIPDSETSKCFESAHFL